MAHYRYGINWDELKEEIRQMIREEVSHLLVEFEKWSKEKRKKEVEKIANFYRNQDDNRPFFP